MGLKKILTIEVGHKNIRICETDYRRTKKPVIYRALSVKTPDNSFRDGYLSNIEELGDYLSRKLKIAGLKRSDVIFTIASNKIMSREVEIPLVKDGLISSLVQAQANEYLPIDISGYIISHIVLERKKQEKKLRLMVFAAPKDLVDNYYRLAQVMAVKIESLDYVGNSIYQWFRRSVKDESGFVIHIDRASTVAAILDKGVLSLQRTIATGTDLLLQRDPFMQPFSMGGTEGDPAYDNNSVAFHNPYGIDDDNPGTSGDEYVSPYAEERESYGSFHGEEGVPREAQEEYISPYTAEVIEAQDSHQQVDSQPEKEDATVTEGDLSGGEELSRDEIEMLIGSISRIMEYHTNSKKGHPVAKIYITGEGAFLKNIDSILEKALEIPVETVRILPGAVFAGNAKEPSNDNQASFYAACAGAALAPADFVPYELADFEQKKVDRKTYAIMLGLVAATCIFVVVICQLHYLSLLQEQKNLQKEIKEKQYIEELYQEYLAMNEGVEYLFALDHTTTRKNEDLNLLFKALEDKLPRETNILSFSTTGDDFSMSFEVASKRVAAKLLMQMKVIEYVDTVYIAGLSDDEKVVFNLTCKYSNFIPAKVKESQEYIEGAKGFTEEQTDKKKEETNDKV